MSHEDKQQSPAARDAHHAGDLEDTVLERNLTELLTRAHEPPAMSEEARARVLARLAARLEKGESAPDKSGGAAGRRPAWLRGWRLGALSLGVAAAAALALVLMRPSEDRAPDTRIANSEPVPERVELADGSEIWLDSGAALTVTGHRGVRLERGQALLDISPGETPFVVESPHGRVVVLGTRFSLDAQASETVAAVVRGVVRLENSQGQETLRAGEAGVLAPEKKPEKRRAPRLSHLLGWTELARRRDEPVPAQPMRKGTLIARDPRWQTSDYPLPVRDFTVDVYVQGGVARVAVDQTFFNAQPMQLEGVYRLPLPAGAAISRLAMYVDGERMEAAVVERMRARAIYESIVYRRRDPALLEWMSGNEFKMRVFPLPARQEKRIALSYTRTLPRLYDDIRLHVPIPEVDTPAGHARFSVRLADCAACQVRSTSHAIEERVDGGDKLLTFEARDYRLGDDLLLLVRDPASANARVARAQRGDHQYMHVRATPDIPAATGDVQDSAATMRAWVVLVDTSASQSPAERRAQAYLIERLLGELDEDALVELVAFDTTVRPWTGSLVRVRDLDTRDAARFLDEQTRDGVGATDLEHALDQALKLLDTVQDGHAGPYAPHILYVGNGVVTAPLSPESHTEPARPTGRRLLERLRGRAVFVATAMGNAVDESLLEQLAAGTGGMVASMSPGDDLSWRAFDLVAALNTPRALAVQTELLDGEGHPVPELTAYLSSSTIADGEAVDIVARWPKAGGAQPARVRLSGTTDRGAPFEFQLDLAGATKPDDSAGYLPRLFAMRHIDALITDGAEAHKDEITRLGKAHFLMTPFTSMIVLENDDMYRQYGVSRKRAPDFAEYRLPERIEVVREPPGSPSVLAASVADATVLWRTPQVLLQSPYGYAGYLGWDAMRFALDEMQPIGGGGIGLGRIATAGVLGGLAGSASEISDLGDESAERSGASAGAADSLLDANARDELSADGDFAAGEITTRALRESELAWSGIIGAGGGKMGLGPLPGRRSRSVQQQHPMWGFGSGRGSGYWGHAGFAYHYYYNVGAPMPAALHYESDPRLDDLSEHVPGLFQDAMDEELGPLRRTALAADRTGGSIDAQARALIDRARAATLGRGGTYRGTGAGVDARVYVDERGRFALERILPTGLVERVLYTGDWLVHVYPELGLATRRPARDAEPVIYDHFLPFLMPAADQLALLYSVHSAGESAIELRMRESANARKGGNQATTPPVIRMEFDQAWRVTSIQVPAAYGRESRRFSYTGDRRSVSVRQGDALVTWERQPDGSELQGLQASFDDGRFTVVDMPLRTPAHHARAEAQATPASDADLHTWRSRKRQELATHAALQDGRRAWQLLREIRERAGQPTVGEMVLASVGARHAKNRAELDRVLGKQRDAIAGYLASSYELARSWQSRGFETLSRDSGKEASASRLVATLAGYRVALMSARRSGSKSSQGRVLAFIAAHPDTPLSYILGYTYATYWQWNTRDRAVAVWDALAGTPWSHIARFEAARALAQAGRYEQAAARFEQLFRDSDQVRPDAQVSSAFLNSSRGHAGWRRFWTQWRERALAANQPARVANLIYAALATNEHADLDLAVAKTTRMDLRDPHEAELLADALMAAGRDTAAKTVLEPWLEHERVLADEELAVSILGKASYIAERQGRYLDATTLAERAMGTRDQVALTEVRTHYVRLMDLYGKAAQASGGAERTQVVQRALAAVGEWRALDPDNPNIDRLAALLLFSMERPDEAWRYLSTVIERHPMEGVSYQVAAEVLESQGRTEDAERLWQRAFEVDAGNPTWLLRRAQAFSAMGQPERARALLGKLLEQRWHERFSGIKDQARRLGRDLERGRQATSIP